jgi:hypothetical protein
VRRTSTREFTVRGFAPEANGSVRLVLSSGGADSHLVGTPYPIGGVDLKPLEWFFGDATPAEHRVWAPFDDGRREWYELPKGVSLVAEVVVTTLDTGVLRQPARFVRWRISHPEGNARDLPS